MNFPLPNHALQRAAPSFLCNLTLMSPRILASLVVALISLWTSAPAADAPTVSTAKPQDGVFALRDIFSSTVLELKDGRFRYWFVSDVKLGREPEYPLSGDYVFEGNTVVLKERRIYDRVWTFRSLNGALTLWRPAAIDLYDRKQQLDPWGILRITTKTAEEAWGRGKSNSK